MLKQKIKNVKFLLIIVLLIVAVLWYQWYRSFSLIWVDRGSYVTLIAWEALWNEKKLIIDEKTQLVSWDKVQTIWDTSIAVIEWWDWSITRMWGSSWISINEVDVSKDLLEIKISFDLTGGKTWSNVISFLWEESYFKQNFDDIEASVRWTVFDVDLEKDYVFVQNHEVELKKDDKIKKVQENMPFQISSFSFVDIQKFFNEMRDNAWKELNNKLDGEYFEWLKAEILQSFESKNLESVIAWTLGEKVEDLQSLEKKISTFSKQKKEATYDSLMSEYQKYNFIAPEDTELFKEKLKLKKLLLAVAWDEEKESLMQYTLYDLKDAIDGKHFSSIKEMLPVVDEYKDFFSNVKLEEIFGKIDISWFSWEMKELFSKNIWVFSDVFTWVDLETILEDGGKVQAAASNLLNNAESKAEKALEWAKGKITDLFNDLTR